MDKEVLITEFPGILPASPEYLAAAEAFALRKWQERARERGKKKRPTDLSSACKFTSLFVQRVFGGAIRGHYDHQFNLINGQIVDLNHAAEDVRQMANPYWHDPLFFGSPDHLESLESCLPRVNAWVDEFLSEKNDIEQGHAANGSISGNGSSRSC